VVVDLVHVQAPHDAAGQGVEQLVVDQLLGIARVAVGAEGDEQGPPVQGARVDVALVAEQGRRIHHDLQCEGPQTRRTVTSSATRSQAGLFPPRHRPHVSSATESTAWSSASAPEAAWHTPHTHPTPVTYAVRTHMH